MSRGDRGMAASVEAAILLPVLILLIGLLVTTARIALAQQSLGAIASHAARAATLERTAAAGHAAARSAVQEGLAEHGLECLSSQIEVAAGALSASIGAQGEVTVTVSCTVPFTEVSIPGMPGSHQLTATAVSSVDRFRQR
ncbi:MAG TPA: TadE/TadG family type IV pilus assembly protein [Arachnia sp.]|nr:TadE/TadG family type IV pilus assembly protein [Arachnia sp.]HMT86022.1 TadE/TadG family type IV pilus assembly protein [Arachnia sp.]